MKREELKSMFDALRNDPHHHLGLRDIRLTIAQQDAILDLFPFKDNPLPPAEGAEEILQAKLILNKYWDNSRISNYDIAILAMTEFATLHAQRLADKMVSERLKKVESLLNMAAGLVGNPGTNISSSCDIACDDWQGEYNEYLKTREK